MQHKSVLMVGSIIGFLSPLFGWLTLKPNRLASGESLSLWNGLGWSAAAAIILLWIVCLILSLFGVKKWHFILLGILANLVLVISFVLAGSSASELKSVSPELTRISLGAGIWISATGAIFIIVGARQRLVNLRLETHLISWLSLVVFLIFLAGGWFNNISVIQEYLSNTARFGQELLTHLYLFGLTITAGTLMGIPLGVWASRSRQAARPIFFLASITQTIPSLALFGLLIAPLSALSSAFPILREFGIRGIGPTPAIIALIIYSLLPLIRNTYTGLQQINQSVIEAGLGMGMDRCQLLRRVETPLAAPLILEGVRTAAVQAIGNTAIAALIGAGGLGQFIFQGLGQAASDLIILGAVPIIVLALIVDTVMQVIIRIATPKSAVREAS